ncbi:hypothetical protein FQN49_000502 [Arthroderma sp. PD_2]|nr:hypothetical protein FQN49_000502 [Arthroderma sp. PD_2]
MERARRINKWTQEEDSVLLWKIQGQQARNPPNKIINWQKIAAALPGRSNKDCRKRWFNVLSGGLRKGAWTAEEDRLLSQAVGTEGKVWMRVAQHVPRRTADQCAKRWQHVLDPALDRSEWTESESQILWDAVERRGRRWLQIRNDLFPLRSPNSLKNQYTFISRRFGKIERNSPEQNEGPGSPNPTSNSDDMDINAERPICCDIGLMNQETQPSVAPMGISSPYPTPHESMPMTDDVLSNFDFHFCDQVGLPVVGSPQNPGIEDALPQYEVANDSLFDPCYSPGNGDCSPALGPSLLCSPSINCQSAFECHGSALPLESWPKLSSHNCSVMTLTMTNPTPEAVEELIRISMTYRQQVTIDIDNQEYIQ